jgi:hypothetical protein
LRQNNVDRSPPISVGHRPEPDAMTTAEGFSTDARRWRAADGLHVDVRGLPCPEPLVTLLRLIDGGGAGDRIIAHLSQEPLLLYPELEARGWDYRLLAPPGGDAAGGDVVLEIVRAQP